MGGQKEMSNDEWYGSAVKFPKASESFKKANPHVFDPTHKGYSAEELSERLSQSKFEAKSEKELQKLIYQDLLRRGLYFHYQRTDRKTTGTVGSPDFILPFKGYFIGLECKTETGRISREQSEVCKQIQDQGGLYYVVRSFDEYKKILGLT